MIAHTYMFYRSCSEYVLNNRSLRIVSEERSGRQEGDTALKTRQIQGEMNGQSMLQRSTPMPCPVNVHRANT